MAVAKHTHKEAQELIVRCRRLLFALGWRGHPFFLIPAKKVRIRVALWTKTASVDPRGFLFINPAYAKQQTDEKLKFVLAHELMHLLMLHFGRQGSRKIRKWNRGTDRAINYTLKEIGLTPTDGALFPLEPSHNAYTAEEFYEAEPEQQGDGTAYGPGDSPVPGAGCGPMQAPDKDDSDSGDGIPGTGEEPENGCLPTVSEAAREWRQTAASAQASARAAGGASAGEGAGDLLARLLNVPPPRVKWSQLLRGACARAVAQHGRDDVSWTRRNRRSFGGDFILPGGVTYRACVAAAVDTSGSVPDESLEQALSEIESISQATKVAIYLVTHDGDVQWEGWVKPGTRRATIASTFCGRGGTLFTPPYEAIEKAAKRFDAMVHLTDGMPCEPWPEKPRNVRRCVVALIGAKIATEVPEDFTVVEAEI